MDRLLLNVLLATVLAGLCSCSNFQTTKKDHTDVIRLEDSDEALGLYAQGLLAFEEDRSQGVLLLSEAMILAPSERRFIDDYAFHVHKKVNRESNLNSDVSDHTILHKTLIENYSLVLKRHSNANYVRLKLVESYLALDNPQAAQELLQEDGLIEDDALLLAKIQLYRVIKHPEYLNLFQKILDSKNYSENINLNLTAIRYLMEKGPSAYSKQLMDHAKALIHSLAVNEKKLPRDITYSLIDAVLFGSDIGEHSRSQSLEPLDYGNELAQWSLLAGILMKFEMNEEAYIVIKHQVLARNSNNWRVLLNLAICCQRTGRKEERIRYLERAYQIHPDSVYTKRSLLAAHTAYGDSQRALAILGTLNAENDFWLQKIHFYLLKNTEKYESAFTISEKLFNWPDPAKKITGISTSFAASIVPVYLKLGKPKLMEKRISQSLLYRRNDPSLLNSLAYQFAEEDYKLEQAEEWIKKVYEDTEVNSAYADTYAWVLYKMGKYEEAKVHIDLALKLEKEISPEILMHAGDIYLKLGYRNKAKEFWKKALSVNSKFKTAIESRLQNLE